MIFSYGGIKKIKIPYKKEDFLALSPEELIKVYEKYLTYCLQAHSYNAQKEDYYYKYFLGFQDIRCKKREFLGDEATNSEANQKVTENHANAQVTFKVDFLMGDKIQFTHKSDIESDDLTFLDRFLADSNFYTAFRETKKMMYAVGVGTTFSVPRTDIIDYNGNYINYNKDTNAPFICKDVDPRYNFVVYSNYYDETPLFCASIIINEVDNTSEIVVNNGNYTVSFASTYPTFSDLPIGYGISAPIKITQNAFKEIPIIEHTRNKERMGLIELNKDLFDVINLIASNSADAIVDTVNNILVFENVEVDEETVKEMRRGGTIQVKSSGDPNTPSKVYTLEVKMNHADVNVFYEQRVSKAYDIAGVPIASGVTSTGGQTGQARLLGGGWENAYTKIKGDIIGMEESDYELLKLLLDICHTIPGNKVNELSASQIEIKYNINPNDNVLSKAQSANNLFNIGMPPEMVLEKTGLSMDTHADGYKWAQYLKQLNDEKNKIAGMSVDTGTAGFMRINSGDNKYNENKEISTPKG